MTETERIYTKGNEVSMFVTKIKVKAQKRARRFNVRYQNQCKWTKKGTRIQCSLPKLE